MATEILVSVTVSTLAYQVPVMVTPVLAGNYIGSYAIAATGLAAPIMEFIFALIFLFAVGSSYIVANRLSVNDIASAKRHYFAAVISTMAAMGVVTAVTYLHRVPLAEWLSGGNAEISGLLADYLGSVSWSFIFVGLYYALDYHLRADGNVKFTAVCNIVYSIVYPISSIVFLGPLGMGMTGFLLSSITSSAIGIIMMQLFIRRNSSLNFNGAGLKFMTYLWSNVKKGFPIMVDDLLGILFFLLSNLIIINKVGASGSVVWSISSFFLTIAITIGTTIVPESSLTLGYSLCASKDYVGCKHMIKKYRKAVVLVIISIIAFVELLPEMTLMLFGESVSDDAVLWLRLSVPMMLVFSVATTENSYYYLFNESGRYMTMLVFLYIGPVVALFVCALFAPALIWVSFSASALICCILSLHIRLRINKRLDSLTEATESLEQSLPYDMSSIGSVLEVVGEFITDGSVTDRQRDAVIHCVDELSYNIIKHAPKKLKHKYFDLRAVKTADSICFTFKYYGKPFNPIMLFSDSAAEALEAGQNMMLALRIFNHYAIQPWYQYSYGVNILSMTVPFSNR